MSLAATAAPACLCLRHRAAAGELSLPLLLPPLPPCRSDTALLLAARRGHTQCVQLLLQHGAATDKANASGVTPLIAAALMGHVGAADALLAR